MLIALFPITTLWFEKSENFITSTFEILFNTSSLKSTESVNNTVSLPVFEPPSIVSEVLKVLPSTLIKSSPAPEDTLTIPEPKAIVSLPEAVVIVISFVILLASMVAFFVEISEASIVVSPIKFA